MSTTSTKQKQADPEHAVAGRYEFDEVLDSITGVEEDEIFDHFGSEVMAALSDGRALKAMRAGIFVLHRRDGVKAAEARRTAQGMTMREVNDFYAEATQESGEGESGPVSEQKKTPQSASSSDSTPPSTES